MAAAPHPSRPAWFPAVAWGAVIWNAFGLVQYLGSTGLFGDPLAGLTAAERAAEASVPRLVMTAFAIGAVTGLAGSLGLALRRAWAVPVLLVSLVALLTLEGWIVLFSGALAVFGLVIPVAVSTGAVLLAWLAGHAARRGWLS